MKQQFGRERSEFWITVHDNIVSYNIATSPKYIKVINFFFQELVNQSPTKWKQSANYPGMYNLWLPKDRCDQMLMEHFLEWCGHITNDVLWVYLSKNISKYFSDELDFCIALDFNIVYGKRRTEIGEAEYQLKYNSGNITDEDIDRYANILLGGMLNGYQYLPIDNTADWFVAPMPSASAGKGKFAWLLAKEMAAQLGRPFLDASLNCNKPQMKELSVEEKIEVWESIYQRGNVELSNDIQGKNVLVIDDLYQSGTTMWQYARFLKSQGAEKVFGLVCVKSLKDSDNK